MWKANSRPRGVVGSQGGAPGRAKFEAFDSVDVSSLAKLVPGVVDPRVE